MPNYPQKVLANDAPYIDSNAQYLFKITVGGGHWAAFSLTAPKSATPFGLDLYSASGTLLATTQKDWTCGTSSANQTGFIALNGNNLTAGTVLYGVVHAGTEQYVAEWYEAPLALAENVTCTFQGAASSCAPFPTGHVAHVFDVTLRAGDNYAIHGGCSGACSSTNQNFQFVVRSRGANANFATGSDYLSVSPTCSGCGSEQVGIAADPADDALHGVIAVQAYGQGQPSVTECLDLEAKSCAAPLTLCDPVCADTQTDVNHCGASCTDCTANVVNAQGIACSAGVCDYGSCNANYGNCTADRSNGCAEYLPSYCGYDAPGGGVVNATGITCDVNGCNYATCDSGYIDCDGNRNNGCETQGTGCPVRLASAQIPNYRFSFDTANLYWMDSGSGGLEKVSKAGGSATALATLSGTVTASDGTNAYVAATTQIAKAIVSGPSAATQYEAVRADLLQIDSTNLYWTNTYCAGTSFGIYKAPLAGSAITPITTSHCPQDFVIDGTNAYWLSSTANGATGDLYASPLSGSGPDVHLDTRVGGAYYRRDIAVANGMVYYAGHDVLGNQAIMKVAITGGTPVLVLEVAGSSLTSDGTNVYYAPGNTGVYRVSVNGGTPTLMVVVSRASQIALALDGPTLYFYDGATLWKMPK